MQRFAGCVDWARRASGEPSGMNKVGMSKHDRSWRNSIEPAEPICAAINHDPRVLVLDQQRAVALVPPRVHVDFAPRTEKG